MEEGYRIKGVFYTEREIENLKSKLAMETEAGKELAEAFKVSREKMIALRVAIDCENEKVKVMRDEYSVMCRENVKLERKIKDIEDNVLEEYISK